MSSAMQAASHLMKCLPSCTSCLKRVWTLVKPHGELACLGPRAPHWGTKAAKGDDKAIVYIVEEDEPLSAMPEKQPGSLPVACLSQSLIRFRANTTSKKHTIASLVSQLEKKGWKSTSSSRRASLACSLRYVVDESCFNSTVRALM